MRRHKIIREEQDTMNEALYENQKDNHVLNKHDSTKFKIRRTK